MISGSGEVIRAQAASPMEKRLCVLGIGLARQIVHVVGMDETGEIVLY
jgi:hypothetical protein